MTTSGNAVVIAGTDADDPRAVHRMAGVARLLAHHGVEVDLVLLRGGRLLDELAHVARVTIYRPEPRGLRAWAGTVAAGDYSNPGRAFRRRRSTWVGRPWIICAPEATLLVPLSEVRPSAIATFIEEPHAHLADRRPRGAELLDRSDLWLVTSERERGALAAGGVRSPIWVTGPVGASLDPLVLPPSGVDDPVVLSTPPGLWSAIDHAGEVASMLSAQLPEVPIVWLTEAGEDHWLADRELRLLGERVGARVTTRSRSSGLQARPKLIVRTGYEPSDGNLVLAAAREGIPTVGFELSDLPVAELLVEPFDVEALVALAECCALTGPSDLLRHHLRSAAIRASSDRLVPRVLGLLRHCGGGDCG